MKKHPAIIQDIRALSPSTLSVRLQATGKVFTFPPFTPGQYATVSFPSHPRLKGERPFSIASSAADTRTIEFGIRVGGNWTAALRTLRPGTPASLSGPFGEFTLDHEYHHSAVMIAGGIGITPFLSMIRTATDLGWKNELTLIYSVRSLRDAAYLDELAELQSRNPGLNVIMVVSDQQVPKRGSYVPGRITAQLIAQVLDGKIGGRSFFVCGPEGFMGMIMNQLSTLGVYPKTIRSERFAVSSKSLIEPGSPMPKIVFAGWGLAAAMFTAVVVHGELERRAAINAVSLTPIVNTAPATTFTPPGTGTSSGTTNTPAVVTPPTTTNRTASPSSTTKTPAATTNTTSTVTTPPAQTYTPPVQQPVPVVVPRTRAS